jgi:hypothetical protein
MFEIYYSELEFLIHFSSVFTDLLSQPASSKKAQSIVHINKPPCLLQPPQMTLLKSPKAMGQ